MILISIHPFAFKKLFVLVVVAFLCLSSAACLADSLFMARQYGPDHRSVRASSRLGEMDGSARTVSLNSDSAESNSLEGVWAGVSVQTGIALANTSAGKFSGCSTNDYAIGSRSVDTEELFAQTLPERRIFLF